MVAKVVINYKSPARYQDTLKILTKIERAKATAIHCFQEIIKNETTVVEAKTTLVCVGEDFKPIPIPEEVRQSLSTQNSVEF